MSYSEIDVQEVLEGFPAPPGMTKDSKLEALRRLDERARAFKYAPLSAPALAARLGVTTRTVTRYRRALRMEVAHD